MKKEDLISIIIPIYNGEKYIKECIYSILNNNYENIELIIIDDGSNDSSYNICEELQKKDVRIKLFKKKNEGIAKTRSFALKKATGKYICFADQDDIVPSNAYTIMKKNIEKNNSDLCIGSYQLLINEKFTPFFIKYSPLILEKKQIYDYLINMTSKCRGIKYCKDTQKSSWTIWNCMYKKEIIDKYGIAFKKFTNYEDDFLFNFDYILKCKKISFEENNVYFWRKNLKSESNSAKYIEDLYETRKELMFYIVSNLEEFAEFNKKKWINLSIEKNFSNAIFNIANPKNIKKDKINVEYLNEIYKKDIKEKNLDFRIEFKITDFFKKTEIINYILCKKGKVKLAYYIDRYIYYNIIFKIINIIKKIIY